MKQFDYRGLSCPMPIIKLTKAVTSIEEEETFLVMADDLAFDVDIKSWSKKMGFSLISIEREQSFFKALMKRIKK